MANRYRRNSSRSTKSKSAGGSFTITLILLGIIIGVLGTTAGYLFFTKESSKGKANPPHFFVKNQERAGKKEKEKEKDKTSAGRFEFYTLLPGMEVQLADESKKTKGANNSNSNAVTYQTQVATATATPVQSPTQKTVISSAAQPQALPFKPKEPPPTEQNLHLAHTAKNKEAANPKATAQYIVQAGIYQELNFADELKAKLALQGFMTRIQKVQTQEGHTWFRVTLGPYASEALALQQKKLLETQNVHGIIILQRPNI